MELTLKLLSGRSAGQEIKIPTNKFLIGRAEDCNLRPHSDLVSRHHCALLVEEGFCAVRDFGSKNGTLVNEERVVGQKELHNGDKVKIGVLEFEVQLTSSVGGKKRPKVKDVKDVAQRTAAGVSRGGEDDDISDWLTEENGTGENRRVDLVNKKQAPHETPNVSARETTFMKSAGEETTTVKPIKPGTPAKTSPTPTPPAATHAPVAADQSRGADAAKKLFGEKMAAAAKGNPKNSRDAAADALKKLFGNKRQ
ncbi:MAG TPA: FHA domain-containing protein [Pirellulales bacterium]